MQVGISRDQAQLSLLHEGKGCESLSRIGSTEQMTFSGRTRMNESHTLHGSGRSKTAGGVAEVTCRRCVLPLDLLRECKRDRQVISLSKSII
jgi:hypothetical protein